MVVVDSGSSLYIYRYVSIYMYKEKVSFERKNGRKIETYTHAEKVDRL